jgi:hypothetical protein
MKQYKFVDPDVTRNRMVEVLVRGLGRKLTDQEIKIIHWIGGCEPETRGVLLDLFKRIIKSGGGGVSQMEMLDSIVRTVIFITLIVLPIGLYRTFKAIIKEGLISPSNVSNGGSESIRKGLRVS